MKAIRKKLLFQMKISVRRIDKGIKNPFEVHFHGPLFTIVFLVQNRNSSFYRQFALAISPRALLWIHRFASCNTPSYHGTRKRRARPACVLLSGTSFSIGAVTRVQERCTMMSMQSSDVVECGTPASEASGNVSSADTSTWSTYLPGRIAGFRRK